MRKKLKKSNVFSSFCRLCLSINENLIDITSEQFDFDIIDLVFDTLDIKFVKQNPVYSGQFVCVTCLDVAQFIQKFKEGCKRSLKVLTKFVINDSGKEVINVGNSNRTRLKEIILEANQVQEESLNTQIRFYEDLYKANVKENEHVDEERKSPVENQIKFEGENLHKDEISIKQEIKEEKIESSIDQFEFEGSYSNHDDNDEEPNIVIVQQGSESGEAEYQIEILTEETEKTEAINNDEKKRNKYKKYECEICHKFMDGYDAKYHMNIHYKLFPFKCEEKDCFRKFTCPSNLSTHLKTVHSMEKLKQIKTEEKNLLPCERCGLKFTRKQLYTHFKRDHADEEYKCEEPECDQTFSNLLRLRKHQKRVHSETPKQKYTCELCGKAFRKTRLKYHMNIHLVCQLAVHKRIIHLKTIKIVCKICGKPFKTKADHDIHFTYHGTPSMPCSICGRLLMNRKTLAKHMLVHTGEKKYKCTFEGCTRAFPVSTGLSVHMRSHTKEKPYSCDDCTEKFTYRIGLRRHAQKIHGKIL
uniref:CSON014881 protein n=1 Tax=Culicoides sonorensis TaxID=179676 RepID=A0A336MC16_CULSO